MIFDQLSPRARQLYEELSSTGPWPAHGLEWSGEPDQVVAELVRLGFVSLRGEVSRRQMYALELQNVLQHRLLRMTTRMQHEEQAASILRQELAAVRDRMPAPLSAHDLVEILTDPAEIRSHSSELGWLAERDILMINTEDFLVRPGTAGSNQPEALSNPPQVEDGRVVVRDIFTRGYLEAPELRGIAELSAESGNAVRIVASAPMKLVIVDEQYALVPLEPTGMTAALLVRSPHLVRAFRELFESVWRRGTDYPGERVDARASSSERAAQEQRQLLNLLIAGLKDDAIASELGVSLRTVRRHVARLQDHFRVDNRMALAVEAARAGWID